MATYLPPVEQPKGLLLKVVYFFMRRRFGTVMTPIAVFSARMPVGVPVLLRQGLQVGQEAPAAAGRPQW